MIVDVPANFTLADLLAHLQQEDDAIARGYRTTKEWADHFGIHINAMRDIFREAAAQDKLRCRRDRRSRIDGLMSPVPVYAFDLREDEPACAAD